METQIRSYATSETATFDAARRELLCRLPKDSFIAIERGCFSARSNPQAQAVVNIVIAIPAMQTLNRLEPALVSLGYYPWHQIPHPLTYQRRDADRIATHQIQVVQYDELDRLRDRRQHARSQY